MEGSLIMLVAIHLNRLQGWCPELANQSLGAARSNMVDRHCVGRIFLDGLPDHNQSCMGLETTAPGSGRLIHVHSEGAPLFSRDVGRFVISMFAALFRSAFR
jgi:hypothetical protein